MKSRRKPAFSFRGFTPSPCSSRKGTSFGRRGLGGEGASWAATSKAAGRRHCRERNPSGIGSPCRATVGGFGQQATQVLQPSTHGRASCRARVCTNGYV